MASRAMHAVTGIVGLGLILFSASARPQPAAPAPKAPSPSQAGAPTGDTPPPSRKVQYSPYPSETFPDNVYFGDTHLHTSYSTDAGMVGCTLRPEDAYRFARGETVTSSTGVPARLRPPYDFLVVSDHSENLGLAPAIAESNPELLKSPWGKEQHDLVKSGQAGGIKAYENWRATTAKQVDPLKDMTDLKKSMWQRETAAAEKYNAPGLFTAFIGFEWTSMPNGNDLHRNVIFRDGKDKADLIVPFSQYDMRTAGWRATCSSRSTPRPPSGR